MNDEPLRLVVHVGDTKRGKTLGVAHFAANTIAALSMRPDVELAIVGAADVVDDYASGTTQVIRLSELHDNHRRMSLERDFDATLQIHHFLDQPLALPVIALVHDLHLFDVPWKYTGSEARLNRLFTQNVERSAFVISEFPRTIDALAQRHPAASERAFVIASPTLISDFEATDAARSWARALLSDDGVPTILYPSQLQAHKNHWNLLAALALQRDRGHQMRVVFTGSSFKQHLTSSIMHRARQLGLDDLVIFAGHVTGEQLRGLYTEVDAVISPSLAEGGAYIAQEAIVHDRPVACSNLESVRAHLARLEVEVPLFEPLDVEAIADALRVIVDRSEEIVAGYRRAHELERSWTWEVVADEITKLGRRATDETSGLANVAKTGS